MENHTEEQQKRALSQIERFINAPPENSRIFTIYPWMAEHLLANFNIRNRTKKPTKIASYAADIASGDWFVTGDTLKFSNTARLRDGQNRLMACLRAGMPLTTHIVFGIDDAAFSVMDRGKVRDPSDVLFMAGFKNTNKLSAATRWAELISTGRAKSRTTFEPKEILSLLNDKFKGLESFVPAGLRVYAQVKQPAGLAAALLYLFDKADADKATAFSAAWQTDMTNGKFKPLLHLRRRLGQMHAATNGRVHDVVRAAMIIKAWNCYVSGKSGSMTALDWSLSEPFPTIEVG